MHFLARHRTHWLLEWRWCSISACGWWFPRYGHCVCSPCHWCGMWLNRRSLSIKSLPPFSTAPPSKIHFADVQASTNRILYGLKQPLTQYLPDRHFWHAQFPACSNHWLARTSLKRLTHSFIVIRLTRSTKTPTFTQAFSFHKLSVPPGYIILVWCVFFKQCCTVITDLDTSKRNTQKAFSCCDAILETGPAACSKHEKRTASSAWGTWTFHICCARVGR
jgi:hypothetical protein